MKTYLILIILGLMVIAVIKRVHGNDQAIASETALASFKKESDVFAAKAIELQASLNQLTSNDSVSILRAKGALKKCRLQYKHIAFFLEYFFPVQALICNGPPVAEAENIAEEFKEPLGLQVIESLLFTKDPSRYREDMVNQAGMLARTAASFSPLLNDFNVDEGDLWKSIHLELVRIITLYITGYDAPQLKSGIEEAHESLCAIEKILVLVEPKDSTGYYLEKGKQYLQSHPDFNSFDRLFFITGYALPIERRLNMLIRKTDHGQKKLPHSTALRETCLHQERWTKQPSRIRKMKRIRW